MLSAAIQKNCGASFQQKAGQREIFSPPSFFVAFMRIAAV